MPTPYGVVDSFQVRYQAGWRHVAQQAKPRFGDAVMRKNDCSGEREFVDQMQPIDAIEKTQRLQATPIIEIDTSIRSFVPREFRIPRHFDEFDAVKLAAQSLPTSDTFKAMQMGIARQLDDIVLEAAVGSADIGPVGAVTTQALTQTIANGGTNMTVDKLLEVKQTFEEAEAWNDDMLYEGEFITVAMASNQLTALYANAEVTSRDYQGEMLAYRTGKIPSFLGMRFVRTQRLQATGNIRECVAWVKSGICLGMWVNPTFSMTIRNDRDDAIQLVGKFMANATRLEEEKVIQVDCDETA